jgi:hypothetical protein
MTTTHETLGDALPKEMARVRDKLLPIYDSIPTGIFAATMMRQDLDRAAKAMAAGDVMEMLSCYESLKGYNA